MLELFSSRSFVFLSTYTIILVAETTTLVFLLCELGSLVDGGGGGGG